jgi:uncharacterized membrane protein YcaP (DUF421 family)
LRWPFEKVLSLATWKLLHRLISWTVLKHDRLEKIYYEDLCR